MQFDNTVQGMTVMGPYGGKNGRMPNDVWISAPLRGKPFGVAASVAFNPLYGDLDPAGMVKLMILEAVSKLVAAGVNPEDVVLCDNFYTPRVTPETARELLDMIRVAERMSRRLGTPFISGKDGLERHICGGKRIQDGRAGNPLRAGARAYARRPESGT